MNTFGSIIGKDFCLDEWVNNTRRIKMPKKDMKLIWVVNENLDRIKITKAFDKLKGFKEREIITSPYRFYDHNTEASSAEGFVKKRWGVAFNMNILNQRRKGDLFVVEDDIFPPDYAYEKLSSWAKLPSVGAATGTARSLKTGRYTTWVLIRKRLLPGHVIESIKDQIPDFDFFDYKVSFMPEGEGIDDIHASGTVCTYMNEEVIKDYVFVGESNLFTGQDVNFGWHITHVLKKRYLVDWNVKCGHWEKDEQGDIKRR